MNKNLLVLVRHTPLTYLSLPHITLNVPLHTLRSLIYLPLDSLVTHLHVLQLDHLNPTPQHPRLNPF